MLQVKPGDRVFAYSDGFIEETDTNGQMLGQAFLEQRLSRMLVQDESLEVMINTLQHYRAGHEQSDDMIMVELTVTG